MNEPDGAVADSSLPASVLDAQVDALSQRVGKDRDQRCAQLQTDAAGQARDILRVARKAARANVHEAIERERKRSEQALRQTLATAALGERQRAQQQTRALLQDMWPAITSELESRWAGPASRSGWVRAACAQARILLTDCNWRIAHGAGWAPQELDALQKLAGGSAAGGAAQSVTLTVDPDIRAGIRISTAGVLLDATLTGLLAARPQVEAEFLAQYLAAHE